MDIEVNKPLLISNAEFGSITVTLDSEGKYVILSDKPEVVVIQPPKLEVPLPPKNSFPSTEPLIPPNAPPGIYIPTV